MKANLRECLLFVTNKLSFDHICVNSVSYNVHVYSGTSLFNQDTVYCPTYIEKCTKLKEHLVNHDT